MLAYYYYPFKLNQDFREYTEEELMDPNKVEELFDHCQILEAYITKEGWDFLISHYGYETLYEIDKRSGWFDEETIEEYMERIKDSMNKPVSIEIPKGALTVLEALHEAGFEAYVVGGCVRDSILGREPQDWDITTSARPEQVKSLFKRTIDTGLKHGTVTVIVEHEGFEVTTYRIDGEYEDGRHPREVVFTPSLEEDLKRRDFTINAMAYNEKDGLVDLFGGLEDMERRQIRCVGEARERFGEDALRILRAVRFSAQLGYEIEEGTRAAIEELAGNLQKISAERIAAELVKLLVSDHPGRLRTAYETGITKVILPEFDRCMETEQKHPHHCFGVGEHILASIAAVPNDKVLRLTMLFHDIGKPKTLTMDEDGVTHFYGHPEVSAKMAEEILKRLKFDNETIHSVSTLVRYHDLFTGEEPRPRTIRRAMNQIGEEHMAMLFEVCRGDILAQSDYMREEKLELLRQWKELFSQIVAKEQCVSLKTMAVKGNDLMGLGIVPGREMGGILQQLLEEVLEDPDNNNREYLLERAKEIYFKP